MARDARDQRQRQRFADSDVSLRSITGWHLAFVALLAIAVGSGFFDDELTSADRIPYEALLAVLGIAYLTLGGPAMRSRRFVPRHAYRVVLVVVLGLSAALEPDVSILLFIAFPQLWLLSNDAWEGGVYSALVAASVGAGFLSREHWSGAAAGQIGVTMAVSLGVSLAMGVWITRVIEQSYERATLIEELEAARDELAEAHHASGVLAERERLAGEIHDTLAQGFTSIVMLAQTAQVELGRSRDGAVAARLASIEETARDNLDEARALVAAFAPAALKGSTLVEALQRLTDRFGAETAVPVSVSFSPSTGAVAGLHPSRQVVLLRAAQEALTNIRKHAGARAVSLRVVVEEAEHDAVIEVIDDGVGFEPNAVSSTGYGLSGMRGRVEQVGGTVDVQSRPGAGTSIRVTVPAGAS